MFGEVIGAEERDCIEGRRVWAREGSVKHWLAYIMSDPNLEE